MQRIRKTELRGLIRVQAAVTLLLAFASGFSTGFADSDVYLHGPVPIEAVHENGSVYLSWPLPAEGLEIQRSDSLGPGAVWTRVPNPPTPTMDGYQVILPMQNHPEYFRLVGRLHHVLIGGQSLAIGANSGPVLSTNSPYQNKMFVGQVLDGTGPDEVDDLTAFVPLVERNNESKSAGETIASGFANWISHKAGLGVHDLLVSNCARGATPYSGLKRTPSGFPDVEPTGTAPYLRGLEQVVAGRNLAGTSQYRCEALLIVHGESDSVNAFYDQDIREWQSDYEADIQRLTGQTNVIPMFHSQMSSWGNLGNARKSLSPTRVLMESIRSPAQTILVCPKYIFPYSDNVHLTSEGYRWLGEYYAKAYYQHIIQGIPWTPVRPILETIIRSNNVVDMSFAGVVGTLVFDTNTVSDPGGTEIYDPTGGPSGQPAIITVGPYGFEYIDKIGAGTPWRCAVVIEAVEITGPESIRITLSDAPRNDDFRIRYGYTALNGIDGGQSGSELGPRGCLRDTDPAASLHGHTLYNWCVHFDLDYLGRN